MIGYVLSL